MLEPDTVVLLATRSDGKLRELRPLFAERGFTPIDLTAAGLVETRDEDALESFATFEENALAKARYFHRRSGMPTIADDSGLAVDALGGAPGVYSKRWSGRADLRGLPLDEENNRLLLQRLADVGDRGASYVCAAAYVGVGGHELVRRGEVRGTIVRAARGAGGFGYDPYFRADELGRTFAEITREEKARVSHRGRAVQSLLAALAPRG